MSDDKLHPYTETSLGKRMYINPGTGPVDSSTEDNANLNIRQLIRDVDLEGITSRRDLPKDYGEGRFAYQLAYEQREVEVQMPGLPLEKVRYLDLKNQSAWDFPRLYVNGSSWLWKYAVDIIQNTFENPNE